MAVNSRKRFRHGTVTVLMTVTVVAIAILCNAILTALTDRYQWYADMRPADTYPVTEACYDYLEQYVVPDALASGERIEIIFCDEEENIKASSTQQFIYHTVTELQKTYPELLDIQYLNVWERPSQARAYGVSSSSAVVVKHGEEFLNCSPRDFFVFASDNASTPVAYAGEKRLSVAMRAVVDKDTPACYITLNHGEMLPDDSLLHAIVDAGYTVNYLDVMSFDIPEDCALLITFNPASDFTEVDGVSGYSELEKLDAYMANGGRYLVFASADTFAAGSLPRLEGFLASWGVRFDHETTAEGIEACYSIKDPNHALSVDGYTILGKIPETGRGAEIMTDIRDTVRVANATGISVADGYVTAENGDHISGARTLTTLLTSFKGAEAWVGGRAVDRTDTGYPLVTLTADSEQGGSLLVFSSVEFASETAMKTSAYDNSAFFMTALSAMGKNDAPVALKTQPFADSTIHILTTAQARSITLVLTLGPAALALVTGLIVLIRRKFA